MSIRGALELIQSFNNPKIVDAPESSLQEGKLHRSLKLFTVEAFHCLQRFLPFA